MDANKCIQAQISVGVELRIFSAVLTKSQANGVRCEPPVEIIEVNDSVHAFP